MCAVPPQRNEAGLWAEGSSGGSASLLQGFGGTDLPPRVELVVMCSVKLVCGAGDKWKWCHGLVLWQCPSVWVIQALLQWHVDDFPSLIWGWKSFRFFGPCSL